MTNKNRKKSIFFSRTRLFIFSSSAINNGFLCINIAEIGTRYIQTVNYYTLTRREIYNFCTEHEKNKRNDENGKEREKRRRVMTKKKL